MCGICGILSTPENLGERERNVVDEMKARILHRGPDGEGTHVSDFAVLGHRRLAIIDLEHGQQPMATPDGRFVLVFNGEIYNYLELRRELMAEGVEFLTESDTEVLLQLLVREREKALAKLNGMFAFVFLDVASGEWLMARDQFGIKPLYYANTPSGQLLFASEIKALLAHPEMKAEVNPVGLNHYLTFQFCLTGETLFKNVHALEPGHYFTGRGGFGARMARYWDADFTVDEDSDERNFTDRLRHLLEDSVRLQLRSDVPVGCHLSGGLDSSSITCLASQRLEGPAQVFTGKFAEGAEYDESRHAHSVADHVGAVMNEIMPTADDFVEYLPSIIRALDEPVAGPGVFPQFMVSKLAVERVKVVLGGQGGDEIFGGYARYMLGYLEQALKGSIYETQEEGKHLVGLGSIIPNLPLLKAYVPLMKHFWREGLFDEMDARYFRLIDRSPDLEDLLTADALAGLDRQRTFEEFRNLFNHPDTKSYINKMTHFDFKTLLPALLQVEDRVSMAVSLESRVPLLDTRIMELVASAPPAIKFAGGETKALLKKAVTGSVPDAILQRKDKMGFPVPLGDWVKGGVARDFVNDVLLSQASLERGLFNREALEKMTSRQGVGGRRFWGALCLELWHRTYIDETA